MVKVIITAVEKFTGISNRTLYSWLKNGIIPDSEDVSVVVKAIIKYLKEQATAKGGNSKKDPLYDEKTRLTKAQADKAEIENQVRAGELVEVDQVQKVWSNYILACRSRLLSLPSKLALELIEISDPNRIKFKLEEEIYAALEELSQNDFSASQSDIDENDHLMETTTETDNQ